MADKAATRRRMNANFDQDNKVSYSKVVQATKADDEALEKALLIMEEKCSQANDFVADFLKLEELGDTVIKVDKLPANITLADFNKMFNTSLKLKNIVATRDPNNENLICMRVILQSSNKPNIYKILGKNGLDTGHNTKLEAKRSNRRELESFLRKNYGKIVELKRRSKPAKATPKPETKAK